MKRCRVAVLLALTSVIVQAEEAPTDFDLAVSFHQSGHYTESRRRFLAIAERCPTDARLPFYLARLAVWFDDQDAALAHLEDALKRFPEDPRLHHVLGDACGLAAQRAPLLSKLKWATRCRAAYERAVELDPRNPTYRMSLLGYFLAAPRLAGGGSARAHAQADAIAEIDISAGRIAWVTVHLAEGLPERAFALLNDALAGAPDDVSTLYQIGRCAALSGRGLEQGENALRQCLRLPPLAGDGLPTHAHAYFRLGNILEKQGKQEEAREAYAAANRLNPDLRPDKMVLKL